MLKSISLQNYKCFKDETTIDIAPLTVLCGVNSSGKSSILKSLLMLKQSFSSNSYNGQMTLSGDYVDNGVFKDVVYSQNGNNFRNKFTFDILNNKSKNGDENFYRADISSYVDIKKIFKILPLSNQITKYSIELDIKIGGNPNHQTTLQGIKNSIDEYSINVKCFKHSNIIYECSVGLKRYHKSKKYQLHLINFPLISLENDECTITDKIDSCSCYYDGIKVVKIYSDKPSQKFQMNNFLANIYALFDIVSTQFDNIKHISPLRNIPKRRYAITQNIREMQPNGEDMLQILAQYGSVPRDYFLIDENDTFINATSNLNTAVQNWASYLNMGSLNMKPNEEILKLDVSGHNLIDVGFGIGQGLPIIINGLHSPIESTLIIEQPEIHLHPKAQMGMADFLLSLSLNGKNVIAETHSDHIINRLVKRIIKDKTGALNSNIKIYFVDKYADNIVSTIEISPLKGIINAPAEFFTQFGSETFDIAKIGMINYREGVNW